jgi:hypothetical protein
VDSPACSALRRLCRARNSYCCFMLLAISVILRWTVSLDRWTVAFDLLALSPTITFFSSLIAGFYQSLACHCNSPGLRYYVQYITAGFKRVRIYTSRHTAYSFAQPTDIHTRTSEELQWLATVSFTFPTELLLLLDGFILSLLTVSYQVAPPVQLIPCLRQYRS